MYVMQFAYIRVPYIYYGNLIWLNGGENPDNRRCIIWDNEKQNKDLRKF